MPQIVRSISAKDQISRTQWREPLLSSQLDDAIHNLSDPKWWSLRPFDVIDRMDVSLAIEAAEMKRHCEAQYRPAAPREIAKMLGALALLYPAARMTESEATARLRLYVDLLSDIPGFKLAAAIRDVAQRGRFFPTVAEIRAAASEIEDPLISSSLRYFLYAVRLPEIPPMPGELHGEPMWSGIVSFHFRSWCAESTRRLRARAKWARRVTLLPPEFPGRPSDRELAAIETQAERQEAEIHDWLARIEAEASRHPTETLETINA